MKVSIIITVYKAEPYIAKCARSLFSQTYADCEFIFVNDASPDKSAEVLQNVVAEYPALADRIKLINNDVNRGVSFSRKAGVKASTGDYVIHVDGDDWVASDFVDCLAKSAIENDSDIVMCDLYYDYGNRTEVLSNVVPLDTRDLLVKLIEGTIHNSLCNKLVRRSLYVDNGIEPCDGIKLFDDKVVIERLVYYARKVSCVSKPLYYYNKQVEGSITSQNKELIYSRDYRLCIEYLESFFADKDCSADVMMAMDHFKVLGISYFLLYGGKEDKSYMDKLLAPISVTTIWSHPCIPLHYKMAVFAYKMKIPFTYAFTRKLIRSLRSFVH